jgi:hypothetical protein
MEGRVKDFLHTEPVYNPPYNNHYGYGHSLGCGDSIGSGRAYVNFSVSQEETYNGRAIISLNMKPTYMIDDYIVHITHVHAPWVMGEIINNDFSTQPCYMTKVNEKYVVADSLREVIKEMREKIFSTMNNDDDIARAFVLAHPEYNKLYDWNEMVTWHSLSHFSCSEGRRNFTKNANKTSGEKATPKELISFMKNSASRNIAVKMERIYLHEEY